MYRPVGAIFLVTVLFGADSTGDWPVYGHDPGGQRFSPLAIVNRGNVKSLKVAWTYRTGDAYQPKRSRAKEFGDNGVVNLRAGLRIPPKSFSDYEETSPPAVIGNTIVVGSGVADNGATDQPSGEIRAFDAATGRLKWTWDPIPQDPKS